MCAYLVMCALIWYREILRQSLKSLQPMLSQWDIGISERVLASCSQKYRLAAGSTLKGWHLQVRQFWEKRPLVVAVSHLHLHLPLRNSNILGKNTDNPFNGAADKQLTTAFKRNPLGESGWPCCQCWSNMLAMLGHVGTAWQRSTIPTMPLRCRSLHKHACYDASMHACMLT